MMMPHLSRNALISDMPPEQVSRIQRFGF